MGYWFTNRLPTEADADEDGEVEVQSGLRAGETTYFHWSMVKPGMAWTHTISWEGSSEPAPPVTTIPRRFASITRLDWTAEESDGCTFDAVADDGTAWWRHSYQSTWTQHPPLPDREAS